MTPVTTAHRLLASFHAPAAAGPRGPHRRVPRIIDGRRHAVLQCDSGSGWHDCACTPPSPCTAAPRHRLDCGHWSDRLRHYTGRASPQCLDCILARQRERARAA